MKENWQKVTKNSPCPICEKPDWCTVTTDGQMVYCMRVESGRPAPKGGWFHRMSDPVTYRPPPKKYNRPEPVKDFTALACLYHEMVTDFDEFGNELGVSGRSLERLQVGWNGNLTFPMRDENEKIIGIRIRAKDGRKWCVPGSHNGLFWPSLYLGHGTLLFLCEGPTDCAALLTLGYSAIGRPSCNGGVDIITKVLNKCSRCHVVIIADNDEAKQRPDGTTYYPGLDGASTLAKAILPMTHSVKIVLPPRSKDIREWLNDAQITKDNLSAIVESTEEYV